MSTRRTEVEAALESARAYLNQTQEQRADYLMQQLKDERMQYGVLVATAFFSGATIGISAAVITYVLTGA